VPVSSPAVVPDVALQRALVEALRGAPPAPGHEAGAIAAALRRYECGGYLAARWNDRGALLPPAWAEAAAAALRKTRIDSLAALGELRSCAAILRVGDVPFVVLKGGAYLSELYPDPGCRPVTDIDLLVPPGRLPRAVAVLEKAGYVRRPSVEDREFQRLQMSRPIAHVPQVEVHWSLGHPSRARVDLDRVLAAARKATFEGIEGAVLPVEEGIVYHCAHAADHYFGPSLKWAIDLREMLRRFAPDVARLRALARRWRVVSALEASFEQQRRLFPGEVPAAAPAWSGWRPRLLGRLAAEGPAEFLWSGNAPHHAAFLRLTLLDGPREALRMLGAVAARPIRRATGTAAWRAH
jgi:hypothetical protein